MLIEKRYILLIIMLVLSGLAGCGGDVMTGNFNQTPVPAKIQSSGGVSTEGSWHLQVEQLERLGDYDSACRLLKQRYLAGHEMDVLDYFASLLSHISDDDLEGWWRRERNKDLLCRIGVEYFFRLRERPEESLSAVESLRILDLARLLSTGCEVDEDIRNAAQARLLAQHQGDAAEIKIGCLLPLSGPNAAAGEHFLRGMEIALEVYPQPEPEPEDMSGASSGPVTDDSRLSASASGDSNGPEAAAAKTLNHENRLGYNYANKSAVPLVNGGVSSMASGPAGVSLPHLQLLLYDTAGEGERARAGVDYLVKEKKVDLLIGPYTGKAANYAAVQAQSLGVTMISLSPLLRNRERYPNVFQHYPTIRNQAVSLAKLARIRLGLEKFALLVPKNRYGREFAEDFKAQVQLWGGQVVRQVEYDAGRPDFGTSIKELIGAQRYLKFKGKRKDYEVWLKQRQRREKQLQAAAAGAKPEIDEEGKLADLAREIGIDGSELNILKDGEVMPRPLLDCDFEALVVPDREQTLKLLIPQLAFYDLNECFLLGGRYWNKSEFLSSISDYVTGSFFVGVCLPAVQNPETEVWGKDSPIIVQSRFQTDFAALNQGQLPDLLATYGFDTIMLLRQLAAGSSSPPDAETWRRLLAGCRNVPLASGLTTTLSDGEIAKDLYPLTFKKGQIMIVKESCF